MEEFDFKKVDWTNAEQVLRAVARKDVYFWHASDEIKDDPAVVRVVAKMSPFAGASYASDRLKNDPDFMLDIMEEKCLVVFASDELKNDPEFILRAMKRHPEAFTYASNDLKHDREFVLRATKGKPELLRYAHRNLVKDREFMLRAIDDHPYALQCACIELRKDKSFVLQAVQVTADAMQYAYDALLSDKEFVLEALRVNYRTFLHAWPTLHRDRPFLKQVMQINGQALGCVNGMARFDKSVVMEAVRSWPLALAETSGRLQGDIDLALCAIRGEIMAIEVVCMTLFANRTFMLEAAKLNLHYVWKFTRRTRSCQKLMRENLQFTRDAWKVRYRANRRFRLHFFLLDRHRQEKAAKLKAQVDFWLIRNGLEDWIQGSEDRAAKRRCMA